MKAYRVDLNGSPGFYSWTGTSPTRLKATTEKHYPCSTVEVVPLPTWDMAKVDEANAKILAGAN